MCERNARISRVLLARSSPQHGRVRLLALTSANLIVSRMPLLLIILHTTFLSLETCCMPYSHLYLLFVLRHSSIDAATTGVFYSKLKNSDDFSGAFLCIIVS